MASKLTQRLSVPCMLTVEIFYHVVPESTTTLMVSSKVFQEYFHLVHQLRLMSFAACGVRRMGELDMDGVDANTAAALTRRGYPALLEVYDPSVRDEDEQTAFILPEVALKKKPRPRIMNVV